MASEMMILPEVAELLEAEARRINAPEFVAADPVQFPRLFSALPDIEIAAFLSATIAWGNRKMICSNCNKMLRLMDFQPYRYVMDCGYDDLGERFNIHRTFFSDDFAYYLRGLRRIYDRYPSVDAFAAANGVGDSQYPSWKLVGLMSRSLPQPTTGLSTVVVSPLDLTPPPLNASIWRCDGLCAATALWTWACGQASNRRNCLSRSTCMWATQHER